MYLLIYQYLSICLYICGFIKLKDYSLNFKRGNIIKNGVKFAWKIYKMLILQYRAL